MWKNNAKRSSKMLKINEYVCKIINSPNSELDIGRDLYLKGKRQIAYT